MKRDAISIFKTVRKGILEKTQFGIIGRVLKLLQETYLERIKMIYIDPQYNTGTNRIYKDTFRQSSDEYLQNSSQYDEEGNQLVENLESNGRFHTDWLNMIYTRIKLAKNLLK